MATSSTGLVTTYTRAFDAPFCQVLTAMRILTVLSALLLTLLAGCASTPVGDQGTRQQVVRSAERLLGTPYVLGGNSSRGLDCSGLVNISYAQAGLRVPRTAADLLRYGQLRDHAEIGDLLVFSGSDPHQASHVGIYAGDDQMIHASSNRGAVIRTNVRTPYWQRHLLGSVSYIGG